MGNPEIEFPPWLDHPTRVKKDDRHTVIVFRSTTRPSNYEAREAWDMLNDDYKKALLRVSLLLVSSGLISHDRVFSNGTPRVDLYGDGEIWVTVAWLT